MSRSFIDISAALDANLNTVAIANNIAVAWENMNYSPSVGTLYLRPTLLPTDSEPIGLANDSSEEHSGIYIIDIISPIDIGKGQALEIADIIKIGFPRGDLIYNGSTVSIRSVSRESGTRDSSWFIVSVLVNYQSIIGN